MKTAFLVAAALLLGAAGEVRAGSPIEHTIAVDAADANAIELLSDLSSKKKAKQASRARAGKAHRAHKHQAHKHHGRKHHAYRHHGRKHHARRHHGRTHHVRTHHVIYVHGRAKRCWVYHPLIGTFNRCTPRGRVLWWRLKNGLY